MRARIRTRRGISLYRNLQRGSILSRNLANSLKCPLLPQNSSQICSFWTIGDRIGHIGGLQHDTKEAHKLGAMRYLRQISVCSMGDAMTKFPPLAVDLYATAG
jgi:hypothetical protein